MFDNVDVVIVVVVVVVVVGGGRAAHVLERALKLLDLLEDELILALPIVPRHTVCPDPLAYDPGVAAAEDSAQTEAPAHPFAALAGLKRGGKPPG